MNEFVVLCPLEFCMKWMGLFGWVCQVESVGGGWKTPGCID